MRYRFVSALAMVFHENVEKDFIPTIMHTIVCTWAFTKGHNWKYLFLLWSWKIVEVSFKKSTSEMIAPKIMKIHRYLKCKTNLHSRRIAAITPPITRSDIIAMMAIILVFLEVFKHFRRDLTLAKEAFETAMGTTSVMLFKFLFLLFFSKNNLSWYALTTNWSWLD